MQGFVDATSLFQSVTINLLRPLRTRQVDKMEVPDLSVYHAAFRVFGLYLHGEH